VLFWLGQEGRNEYACLRRLQMAAEAGRAMAVFFRSTAAEKLSTPAHLRVVLAREEGVLKLRIPKRRGPALAAPIALSDARSIRRSREGRHPVEGHPVEERGLITPRRPVFAVVR
jgi:hypothetical protein